MAKSSLSGLKKGSRDKRRAVSDEELEKIVQGTPLTSKEDKPTTTKKKTASQLKVTFSLTQEISDEIDTQCLRIRTTRINRSDIVKMGLLALQNMSDEKLEAFATKYKN